MSNWCKRFWDWVDGRAVIRRIAMLFTLYMTWYVTYAGWLFSQSSHFDGLGTAAVIAAFTAPTAALQGAIFKWYTEARTGAEGQK